MTGSLIVVGTGLKTVGQVTTEAIAHIAAADSVYYVIGDPVGARMVTDLNPRAHSLEVLYAAGKERFQSYTEMIETVLAAVRVGQRVCAVFYGHPGVFVYPSHEMVRRARAEGYAAAMLPGVSAEDCLFADIGVDPAANGCQSYEATDWLFNNRATEPSCALVLWQIGVLGNEGFSPTGRYDRPLMPLLIWKLTGVYGAGCRVAAYEASVVPGGRPRIDWMPAEALTSVDLTAATTLWVPPAHAPTTDMAVYGAAQQMGVRLGGS